MPKKVLPKKNTKQVRQLSKNLRRESKKKVKVELFLRTRMWFHVLASKWRNDRGGIPRDIGNRVFMGNNIYITKEYMTAVYLLTHFPDTLPHSYLGRILTHLKREIPGIVVDMTIRNSSYAMKKNDYYIERRAEAWKEQIEKGTASESKIKQAVRLLHSYNILKTSIKAYKSRIFLNVRAKDALTLESACATLERFLKEEGVESSRIMDNLQDVLEYSLILSSSNDKRFVDLPSVLTTVDTMADILPNSQGYNDIDGMWLGIDERTKNVYCLNNKSDPRAKNFYIYGSTDAGKTFLVSNWSMEAIAQQEAVFAMDIKGTEFGGIAKACGGHVLSMRPDSTSYINSFKMNKKDLREGMNPEIHFRENCKLSKETLLIASDIEGSKQIKAGALIDSFINAMYISLGVATDNPNTWYRTESLSMFEVYALFCKYLSPDIRSLYADVADDMLMSYNVYLNPKGSGSDLFRNEYQLYDVLNSNYISVDYGILSGGEKLDKVSLRLKMKFMEVVMMDFIRMNNTKGKRTMVILEESQYVPDDILKIYAMLFSIGRSMKLDTFMLGNSVRALTGNSAAKSIIDNINVIVAGKGNADSIEELIKTFGLSEHREILTKISSRNSLYDRVFLLVNRISPQQQNAYLRLHVPQSALDNKVLKHMELSAKKGIRERGI